MAEVKHTPGPWKVIRINERGQQTPDGDSWWVYAGNGNGWVGESYMSACLGVDHGAEANARLIAAAPDLFEAGTELQAARKAQKLAPSAENLSRVRAASDAFDAALSKATAQQEGR